MSGTEETVAVSTDWIVPAATNYAVFVDNTSTSNDQQLQNDVQDQATVRSGESESVEIGTSTTDTTNPSNNAERESANKQNEQESTSTGEEQRHRDKDKEREDSRFECNICLDTAKDAVVSMCGHLFCWPCLYQWLDTRPYRQLCPVCKSAISKEKVIPLYGRGGGDSDPREKIPPRPQGQRTEDTNPGFPGMFQWGGDNGGHGGVQFSLGIGVFPISFFASFFNTNLGGAADRRSDPPPNGSRQMMEEQFLSNTFLYIGVVILLWLMFL